MEYSSNSHGFGAAYLFDTASGEQLAKLVAPDATDMDEFGRSVAYHNGWAVVGAWRDDDAGQATGSAYLFRIPEPATISLVLIAILVLNARC